MKTVFNGNLRSMGRWLAASLLAVGIGIGARGQQILLPTDLENPNLDFTQYRFGISVAQQGDWLVVGAPGAKSSDGRAFVYRWDSVNNRWRTHSTLEVDEIVGIDAEFGSSVDIAVGNDVDGNGTEDAIIAVGSPLNDVKGERSGAVYLYAYDAASDSWGMIQRVNALNGSGNDLFGASLSLAAGGKYLAVGAYLSDFEDPVAQIKLVDIGSVHVFEIQDRDLDDIQPWVEVQRFRYSPDIAFDGQPVNDRDNFGWDLDMWVGSVGSREAMAIAIGSRGFNAVPPNGSEVDNSGGVFLVTGTRGLNTPSTTPWSFSDPQYLDPVLASQGSASPVALQSDQQIGASISLDVFGVSESESVRRLGIAVGAPRTDIVRNGTNFLDNGEVYAFEYDLDSLFPTATRNPNVRAIAGFQSFTSLLADDAIGFELALGEALDFRDRTVIAGAPEADRATGRALVFSRRPDSVFSWQYEHTVTGLSGSVGDVFGRAVAVGDFLKVLGLDITSFTVVDRAKFAVVGLPSDDTDGNVAGAVQVFSEVGDRPETIITSVETLARGVGENPRQPLGKEAGFTNLNPIPLTIDFSESVTFLASLTGLSAEEINARLNPITGSGAAVSSRIITPTIGSGPLNVGFADAYPGILTMPNGTFSRENVSALLSENTARSALLNGNEASNRFQIIYDNQRPELTGLLGGSAPLQVSTSEPLIITAQFSETIWHLGLEDIRVERLEGSGFVEVPTEDYIPFLPSSDGQNQVNFMLLPEIGSGTLRISLRGESVRDAAGNLNVENGVSLEVRYDRLPPEPRFSSLTSAPPFTICDDPIEVQVNWNEVVTGFDASDLIVQNGVLQNFVRISGSIYTFSIVPNPVPAGASSLRVTAEIVAGAAIDSEGNPSLPSDLFTRNFDDTRPTVDISFGTAFNDPNAPRTNFRLMPVRVRFSEPIVGFEVSDILIENGRVEGAIRSLSTTTYFFNVVPNSTVSNVAISVSIPGAVVTDRCKRNGAFAPEPPNEGNPNVPSQVISYIFDPTLPTPTIHGPLGCLTGTEADFPFNLRLTFDEVVRGFSPNDFIVTGGRVTEVTAVDDTDRDGFAREFIVGFEPDPLLSGEERREFSLSLLAGATQDKSGNPSALCDTETYVYDPIAPTPNFGFGQAGAAGAIRFEGESTVIATEPSASIPVVVEFNEPVFRFAPSSVMLTRVPPSEFVSDPLDPVMAPPASIENFRHLGDGRYEFDVTSLQGGEFYVWLPEGAARDVVDGAQGQDCGNPSVPSFELKVVLDEIRPSIRFESPLTSPTTICPIPVLARFSEPVRLFASDDLSIGNAVLGAFYAIDPTTGARIPESEMVPDVFYEDYEFTLIPGFNDEAVTVDVFEHAAVDVGGLTSAPADQFRIHWAGPDFCPPPFLSAGLNSDGTRFELAWKKRAGVAYSLVETADFRNFSLNRNFVFTPANSDDLMSISVLLAADQRFFFVMEHAQDISPVVLLEQLQNLAARLNN